ncbi:hypothetical protein M1B35_10840 [Pseudomonas sp. MAFF 302046]|uniref:Uncharacterized protein n=1 Tax=Pseudomonas morbosilactucae TaxID=2938197 RepID=A0ABT0JFC1_9PSED|nr:hypothetical protein [Pseudomonas morbosilactucae]MCK9814607.1 hypothetical protein [Pseudomonas morbosilactucae]
MAQSKQQKIIKNTLARHEADYDERAGKILITDFYQLSQILESLKEHDRRAFNAFYALIEANLELEAGFRERGSRIAKLQRGQTQQK